MYDNNWEMQNSVFGGHRLFGAKPIVRRKKNYRIDAHKLAESYLKPLTNF